MADVVQTALLLAFGVTVGAYGAIVGVGGGFLIVPALILFLGLAPSEAAGTSLAVVFFGALSGALSHLPSRRIDFRAGVTFALATVPGAIVGAYASAFVAGPAFDLLFGILLLAVAVVMQLRPLAPATRAATASSSPPARGRVYRAFSDRFGQRYEYSYSLPGGIALSLVAGFVASLFGIGGGVIQVPALIFVFGFPPHVASATSVFILTITSAVGALSHAALGHVILRLAIVLAIGVIVGARIGVAVAPRLRGVWLVRLLSLALAAIGIRLIVG